MGSELRQGKGTLHAVVWKQTSPPLQPDFTTEPLQPAHAQAVMAPVSGGVYGIPTGLLGMAF